MRAHARTVRIRAAGPLAKLFVFPATHGTYTARKEVHSLTRCESESDVNSKCTAMMGDHVRLLSFSSASSPQPPVLTAPNGQCMLPRAVFLHNEACFARQKRPREENSTPPKWPPRTDNKSPRDSPHLVRLGQSMELSMALKVANSSPPTLWSHLLSQLNLVCFEWS